MNRIIYCVFSAVLFVFSVGAHADTLDCQQQHCIGVIDAGSTGSRLHVFTYDLDDHNTPIHITEKWSKKVKPGLATLDNNQAAVNAYLSNLVVGAPSASMPVYFYATAGMRLLPQVKQTQMWNLVNNWFNQQSQWELKEAKTITGKQEGVFAWLSVNYQLGRLEDATQPLTGVMDMGGASVQITFPIEPEQQTNEKDIQTLFLYGRHLSLFAHSFLGLGQTELSHQFLNNEKCFSKNYTLSEGHEAKGDALQCKRDVLVLINSIHHVKRIIQSVLHKNPVNSWYLMRGDGVTSLVKSKPFEFPENQFNSQSMLIQGNAKACHQDWSTLESTYPNDEYLYGFCLFSSSYYALMVNGYGIDPNQTLYYLPATSTADWTTGVVLMLNAA